MARMRGKKKASKAKTAANGANATPAASEPIKTDGDALAIVSKDEQNAKNDKNEELKNEEEVENTSNKKANKLKKKKKKATPGGAVGADAKDADKPETSSARKGKKAAGMGMIFMCNSKTKKDCYRYNVLGLPASKKDMVAKIYKGMRLFLFDIDLKLMYGIYKAASPGGYNIESKAFKSAFPSQVRFSVLDDCLPLAEEKFKVAIKENYYGKNKFKPELTPEQVKNLCKLFRVVANGPKPKKSVGPSRTEAHISRDWDRKRRLDHSGVRHFSMAGDHMFPRGHQMYEREAYASPSLLPPHAYNRPSLDLGYYRRGPELERHDRPILDHGVRQRDEMEYRDPYRLYREPVRYRDPLFPEGLQPGYPPPPLYRY